MLTLALLLAGCRRPDGDPGPHDPTPTDLVVPPDTGTDTDTGTDPPVPAGPTFVAALSDTNLVTLTWTVPEADPAAEVYLFDLGPSPMVCDGGPPEGCSVTTRVGTGGIHEFTLMLPSPQTYLTASVDVPAPLAPALEADLAASLAAEWRTIQVDLYAPADLTLRWDESGRPSTTFLRLRTPGLSSFADGEEVPLVDSRVVPASTFAALGTSSWSLEACDQPESSDVALCSERTPLSVKVEPGLPVGGRRIQAGPGGELLSWQSAGNLFLVSAPSLGIEEWVAGPPFAISPEQLVPGVHEVLIVPCRLDLDDCANRNDTVAPSDGTVSYPHPLWVLGDVVFVAAGQPVADIDTGSGVVTLVADATGQLLLAAAEGDEVEAGADVYSIITDVGIRQALVVDDGVSWDLDRHWSEDFTDGSAVASWPWKGAGQPLDIAMDDAGNVWVDGEFTRRLFHVFPDGQSEALTFPLLHTFDEALERYVAVRPFANPLSGVGLSDMSAYGERVVVADDGTVWATLGGHGYAAEGNHSRLLRFDPAGLDLPSTLHDDRFCAYAVPGDGNAVVGLAADGDRVWWVESLGARLSLFEPRPEHCEPLLDYEDPAAVAASALQPCAAGQDASDGCVQQIALTEGTGPAHVAIDPVDGTAWVSDLYGTWLMHVLPDLTTVEAFRMPTAIIAGNGLLAFYQGFPWQIRVTDDAVYLGEYSDVSIVRFDKSTQEMDEIAIPYEAHETNLHSIDIDDDERLWFTISAEGAAQLSEGHSTIGYVDLAAWRAGAPSGVIYRGLEEIVDPARAERATIWAPCFRGIDVDPAGAHIALGSVRRDEAVILTLR